MPISFENIRDKSVTVGVIGMGYVGLPLSLAFTEAGVNVIGFDVDTGKIEKLNRGESYFKHFNGDRVSKAIESGKLRATDDFSMVDKCGAVLICVPTPLDQHLEPDLRYVTETCHTIAPHLRPETLVSLESTTWPGTTEEVIKKILEEETPLRCGKDLYLAYSPEREDPGNKSFNTQTIPKLVGGVDEESGKLAAALYELAVTKVVTVSGARVAEAAKLFENIFRSVNIALVNELKIICEPMGLNACEVIEAAATKPFGFMPFWPGPGLGGHCIPIDPFYLTWKAKEFGISTKFIELAGEINRSMPHYVTGKVQDCLNEQGKALKGAKILILGLAYKSDIDDMRESPSLELIRLLEEKGAQVDYHDPHIPKIGPTREYSDLEGRESQPIGGSYDCLLFATKHSCFDAEEIAALNVPTVDTRNFLPEKPHIYRA